MGNSESVSKTVVIEIMKLIHFSNLYSGEFYPGRHHLPDSNANHNSVYSIID